MKQRSQANGGTKARPGLPETLKIIRFEKCTATVAAKVEPSLKKYILEHGGSCFIHTMIMQSLAAQAENSV